MVFQSSKDEFIDDIKNYFDIKIHNGQTVKSSNSKIWWLVIDLFIVFGDVYMIKRYFLRIEKIIHKEISIIMF